MIATETQGILEYPKFIDGQLVKTPSDDVVYIDEIIFPLFSDEFISYKVKGSITDKNTFYESELVELTEDEILELSDYLNEENNELCE